MSWSGGVLTICFEGVDFLCATVLNALSLTIATKSTKGNFNIL